MKDKTIRLKNCISCDKAASDKDSFIDSDHWRIHYRCAFISLRQTATELLKATDFQVEELSLDATTIIAARNLQDTIEELGGERVSYLGESEEELRERGRG